MTLKIDSIDERIVNELSKDSKMTLRRLAKKLGISAVTAMNRIKALEKEGIIRNYTIKVDYEKLGYGTHVIIEVKISKGKLFDLEKKIANSPNVYAVYDSTGQFDATVIGRFKSTRAMDAFLKKIQTFDFVEGTHTKLVLNTIKEENIKL